MRGPVERRAADVHAVELDLGVVRLRAVNRHAVAALARDARGVGRQARRGAAGDVHGRDQQRQVVVLAGRRQRFIDVAVDRRRLLDALDVDDRGCLGDGDRLRELADRHLHVDIRRESRGQLDPLAHERAEPGQHEGHGVGARLEGDDAVLAVAVRDGRAHLLDQRRAAGFNRHARQHAARFIGDRAADGLRAGRAGGKAQKNGGQGRR